MKLPGTAESRHGTSRQRAAQPPPGNRKRGPERLQGLRLRPAVIVAILAAVLFALAAIALLGGPS